MSRPRRLLLRATSLITIAALLLVLAVPTLAAPVVVPAVRPPAYYLEPSSLVTAACGTNGSPVGGCSGGLNWMDKPAAIGGYYRHYRFSDSVCRPVTGWRFTGSLSDTNGSVGNSVLVEYCNGTTAALWSGLTLNSIGNGWNSIAQVSVLGVYFTQGNYSGAVAGGETLSWGSFEYDVVDPTATPTNTPPPTNTPLPTATLVAPTGNLIRNWDFATPPRVTGAIWASMNRVVQQVPFGNVGDPELWDGISAGSCGPEYWSMSRTGGTDGRIYQDFGWTGGPMYINFEAVTNNYVTRGEVSILNRLTGDEVFVSPAFTNGSMSWQSFKYVTGSQAAGQYRIGFSYDGFGSEVGLGLDNVNVRGGYWGNDCPAGSYSGQMPTTLNATAVAAASPTPPPYTSNTPINTNCGFEQGWQGYARNAGARLFYTGGATGPTYAYLYTIYDNGSDPQGVDITGRLASPFYWPGGQMMYVSYFTGPGTRATVTLRNAFTNYSRVLQSPATAQSYGGWVKRSLAFNAPVAGNYELVVQSAWGQIAAVDGIAVSTGGFASGPCSSSNTNSDNEATATQHIANTSVASTATNQPGVILTSHAVGTNQANAYATYLAGQYATMTQNAANTQTAAPPSTQTQAAQNTATQAARLTATAQGTPVPAPTATPQPQATYCPVTVCVLDPPVTIPAPDPAESTAIAATLTAQANAWATFAAMAQTQAAGWATATAAAQQTANAAPAAATLHAAQTATARANQTAIAAAQTATAIAGGLIAQQTQQALQTQQAQQAAATQTAAAAQLTAAAGNATDQAEATQTAVAYATTYAGVTATANANSTADAVATAAAQSTQSAQATANSIATSVSLATQQAGQAQATQTAVAQQTSLAATANPTANAAATQTAQAYATTYAQVTATAQAAATNNSATQQASGTTTPGDGGDLPPVDDRPEPGPSADCVRPSSPLQVANWIDYEVCRILTWFAWSPSNTDQLLEIEDMAAENAPWGILAEIGEGLGVFLSWLGSLNWCDTGFCQGQPLAPLNLEASGILNGNWDFNDGTPYYSDECTILMGPLLGPYIQSGACFCVNVLCALGVLPWFQLVFNALLVFMLLLYVKQTWMTAAHT